MFERIEKALVHRGHVHSALSVRFLASILERLYRSKKSKKEQMDWMFDLFDRVYRSMSLKQWEIKHVKTLQSLEKLEYLDGTLTPQQQKTACTMPRTYSGTRNNMVASESRLLWASVQHTQGCGGPGNQAPFP